MDELKFNPLYIILILLCYVILYCIKIEYQKLSNGYINKNKTIDTLQGISKILLRLSIICLCIFIIYLIKYSYGDLSNIYEHLITLIFMTLFGSVFYLKLDNLYIASYSYFILFISATGICLLIKDILMYKPNNLTEIKKKAKINLNKKQIICLILLIIFLIIPITIIVNTIKKY